MGSTLPPGLTVAGSLDQASEGGSTDWHRYDRVRLYTNAFIRQNDKLLLGYKKRGFGKGLYNGFGGKIDPGETAAEAAVRELQEEAGITALLEHRGTLFFTSADSEEAAHIEIFYAEKYSGTITESEEMRPQWFAIGGVTDTPAAFHRAPPGNTLSLDFKEVQEIVPIPFDKMWEDDTLWMPLLLTGRHFVGRVDFDGDGHLQKWWFGVRPAGP